METEAFGVPHKTLHARIKYIINASVLLLLARETVFVVALEE